MTFLLRYLAFLGFLSALTLIVGVLLMLLGRAADVRGPAPADARYDALLVFGLGLLGLCGGYLWW